MSIEQTGVIDFVGIEKEAGNVVLTISDHLGWEAMDKSHLILLQERINTYLRFVESGELVQQYPSAIGRNVVISVVGKYQPSKDARDFLDQAAAIVAKAGIELRFQFLLNPT